MASEIVPPCCGERTCQRAKPIRVMRSGLTGAWYAVTDYIDKGGGAIEARQKHQLHPDDAAQLEHLHRSFMDQQARELEGR